MPWAAAAAAVASVAGAAISSNASQSAANTQAGSANQANALITQQNQQTAGNLLPFLSGGTNSLSALLSGVGLGPPPAPTMTGGSGQSIWDLISIGNGTNLAAFGPTGATNAPVYQLPWGQTNPSPTSGVLAGYLPGAVQGTGATPSGQDFKTLAQLAQQQTQNQPGGVGGSLLNSPLLRLPTSADFTASPGFNFEMQQGIDAIQNSAAAGANGGIGGNLMQQLQRFGTGLASQDWWTFVNQFTGQQNRALSSLFNLTGSGQNAAVQQGGFGAGAAGQIGNNVTGAGNALASGQVGVGNAIGGGLSNLSNMAQLQFMLNQQGQGNLGAANAAGDQAIQNSTASSFFTNNPFVQ